MKLPREEADLFFRLMWGLQHFVNQRLQLVAEMESVEAYARLPQDDKVRVRDALWENPALIEACVKENPHGWTPAELDIVRKWKDYIKGSFQIYRFLKDHAIFIGEEKVYGVLSLYDSLADILSGQPLPVMVEAVLLPFKGRIVYDGLFRSYNIYFGRGIRSGLHEQYMAAKQNNRIITALEPGEGQRTALPPRTSGKDWTSKIDAVVKATEPMKGGPAIQSAAFALLRASAQLARSAVHQPDELKEVWQRERQVHRALNRLRTALDRAEE